VGCHCNPRDDVGGRQAEETCAASTPLLRENVAGHLLFGMGSRDVNTVIVNGRIAMENRTFPWDVAPVYAEAQRAAQSLWRRMDSL